MLAAILASPLLSIPTHANDAPGSWRDRSTLTGHWNGHRPTLKEDRYDIRMSLT